MGFGIATILLNLHNIGYYPLDSMVLAIGFFYGGLSQVIAGIMEWKRNNTFGTTAFISYGLFWLSLVSLIVMPGFGIGIYPNGAAMSAYFAIWGFFTLLMFLLTFRINKALQLVFLTLLLLFMFLAFSEGTGDPSVKSMAGYIGIVCGTLAIYTAAAQILNEAYGKKILPLGIVK